MSKLYVIKNTAGEEVTERTKDYSEAIRWLLVKRGENADEGFHLEEVEVSE